MPRAVTQAVFKFAGFFFLLLFSSFCPTTKNVLSKFFARLLPPFSRHQTTRGGIPFFLMQEQKSFLRGFASAHVKERERKKKNLGGPSFANLFGRRRRGGGGREGGRVSKGVYGTGQQTTTLFAFWNTQHERTPTLKEEEDALSEGIKERKKTALIQD